MTTSKKWADGPFKLISTPRAALNGEPESPASRNASEMALIHNVLLRGLNSIYLQAPLVCNSPDVFDFMVFCDAWSAVLHTHHHTEETVYFPLLDSLVTKAGEDEARIGVQERNHDDHETFLPGVLAFDVYISGVKDDGKEYEAEKLRALIDAFGPQLEAHLRNEIVFLLSLGLDKGIDWMLMGTTMVAHSKKVSDRVREVPFLMTNSDVTFESGHPWTEISAVPVGYSTDV